MIKARRQRQWLLSATAVTTAAGLVACLDRTLGCNGSYACAEPDGAPCGYGGPYGGLDATTDGQDLLEAAIDGQKLDGPGDGQQLDAGADADAGPQADAASDADAASVADADAAATVDADAGPTTDAPTD
jgi:hypothetical protein